MSYSAPTEEYGQSGRIQGILNKYTVASIGIEIEWLAAVKAQGGVVTWDNVEHMMLEIGNDRIVDLQLSSNVAVTRERAVARRQQIYDTHVQIFDCDLVVLTPGLTETWFDTKTGLYIQRMPRLKPAAAEPDRFTFEVMDFFQCLDVLDRAIRTLRDNGAGQIAMTVSPVPLQRTMTDKDVLVANGYSKATLRSAVGLICDRYDFVHYVPSYERVTLSTARLVWRDDLRHVTDEFVGTIASAFAGAVLGKTVDSAELLVEFDTAVKEKREQDALALLDKMGARANEVVVYNFVRTACKLLIDTDQHARALPFARRLQDLRPHAPNGYKLEYKIHRALGDDAAADSVAARGMESCKELKADWFTAQPGGK